MSVYLTGLLYEFSLQMGIKKKKKTVTTFIGEERLVRSK